MNRRKSPATVWVLDRAGYDARGGVARVFSSVDTAKAAVSHVTEWLEQDGWLEEKTLHMEDAWVIYPVVIDSTDQP